MTMYEPNPEVRPTGEEAGEFVEAPPRADDAADGADADPERRPTGSLPLRHDESSSHDSG
jgi:hypothetical protein